MTKRPNPNKKIKLRNGDIYEYVYKRAGIYYTQNGLSVGEKLVEFVNYGNGWRVRV